MQASSAPMLEILERLEAFGEFEVISLVDDCVVVNGYIISSGVHCISCYRVAFYIQFDAI